VDVAIAKLAAGGWNVDALPTDRTEILWGDVESKCALTKPELSLLKNYKCSQEEKSRKRKSIAVALESVPDKEDRQMIADELYSLQQEFSAMQRKERESFASVVALRGRVRHFAEAGPASVCRSIVEMELSFARRRWREAAEDTYSEWSRLLEEKYVDLGDGELAEALSMLVFTEKNAKMVADVNDRKLEVELDDYSKMQCFLALQNRGEETINECTCRLLSEWIPEVDLEVKCEEAHAEAPAAAVREAFRSLYSVLSQIMHKAWPRFEDLTLIIPKPRHPLTVAHCFAIATLAKRAHVPYKFGVELDPEPI